VRCNRGKGQWFGGAGRYVQEKLKRGRLPNYMGRGKTKELSLRGKRNFLGKKKQEQGHGVCKSKELKIA